MVELDAEYERHEDRWGAQQSRIIGGLAMSKREAFTLVELTVTMSAGSAMMILAIGMLHQSMSLATVARQRADHQRSLDRLAGEFRQDVHRAVRCTVDTKEDAIELIMPDDNVVTYKVEGNHVARRQPLHDGLSRREAFEFNDSSTATFESLQQPARAVLTVIHRPTGGLVRPRVDRKVAAVLGRLTQHEQAEATP
jgi:hypothetical protein